MAESDNKSIAIKRATKERAVQVLADRFPPGTYDWAFYDALVTQALDQFESGAMTVLGFTVPSAPTRNRTERSLRGASSASQDSAATPMADSTSSGSEGPSPEAS